MAAAESNGAIGGRRWAIAEGQIPSASTGESRALESHEAACMLNSGDSPVDDSRQPALALLSTVAHQAS